MLKKILNSIKGERSTGLLLNEADPRDIMVSAFQAPVSLPDSYICPDINKLKIYNQGDKGTCVAHVFATIKQFQEIQESKIIDFSRRYIYKLAHEKCGFNPDQQGLYPRITCLSLKEDGAIETEKIPEGSEKLSHEKYLEIAISEEIKKEARSYGIQGFAFVTPDTFSIKQAILKNGLVAVAMPYGSWFKSNGNLEKPKDTQNYHYVTLYGWSDQGAKTIFFFRNSWGENWGDKGNGQFFDYEYMPHLRDIVVLTDIPKHIIDEAKEKKFLFTQTLKRGSVGHEVLQLQKTLIKQGFLKIEKTTSFFGDLTRNAVIEFQKKNNLVADGIVGKKTREVLNGITEISLVDALIQVESGGNDNAIGDHHLSQKAYGCLQIRQPCVDDVNELKGTNYKAQDCLGNRNISLFIFENYMSLYATEKNIGRKVTDEDKARIWNGGPSGWKRTSTLPYWEKVKKILAVNN